MLFNVKPIGCICIPFGTTLCKDCGGVHHKSTICKLILKSHSHKVLYDDGTVVDIYA